MFRYTANSLRNSLEVGTTSNWVVSFEAVGDSGVDPSPFNIITDGSNGHYSPVLDIDYDQSVVHNKEFNVGPGINFKIPVYSQHSTKLRITFYDDHLKSIRSALLDWQRSVLSTHLGKSPNLTYLKGQALLLVIYHFDKGLNNLRINDSLYILPDESTTFRGDQDFLADSLPVTFNVIGVQ